MEGWFEFGTYLQSPSLSMKHEKEDIALNGRAKLTDRLLVPHAWEWYKDHKIWVIASDNAQTWGKFACKAAVEETPDPLLQIDVQSDLDLLIACNVPHLLERWWGDSVAWVPPLGHSLTLRGEKSRS